MKITHFKDIPQFTKEGDYQVEISITRIPNWIVSKYDEDVFYKRATASKSCRIHK